MRVEIKARLSPLSPLILAPTTKKKICLSSTKKIVAYSSEEANGYSYGPDGTMRSMRSMRGGFIFRNRGPSLKVHHGQHLTSMRSMRGWFISRSRGPSVPRPFCIERLPTLTTTQNA
jgi:hypothetical protein